MIYAIVTTVLVVILFLIFVATRPADFVIQRSDTIPAAPADVFQQINSLRNFNGWSPWAQIDPNCQMTFSGPDVGVGAAMTWNGNKKVGEGRMEITESHPSRLIKMDLKFLRPFPAQNRVEFQIEPAANQPRVTWSMFGTNNFMSKLFCSFMNMDKMVGRDFEKGLANLKQRVA